MSKTFTYDDVPVDVWEVWAIRIVGQPVGMETWNRCNEVIKKYPEWFEWEHKYDNIPQLVHDAYKREAYSWEMPKVQNNESFGGMIPTVFVEPEIIDRSTQKPISIVEVIANLLKSGIEERERKEVEKKKAKAIWDKHYSKYGLEYRE